MTQSNNRISEGNPREDPVVTMWQKPEASNQTNDPLQPTFPSEAFWISCETHCDPTQLPQEGFVFFCLFCVGKTAKVDGGCGGTGR